MRRALVLETAPLLTVISMRCFHLVAGVLAAVSLGASQAMSQISLPGQPDTRPLALSISGGISLGSYQAGVNWGLLEVFRRVAQAREAVPKVPIYRLSSISGASAGNINTLLWAVEACTMSPTPTLPEKSLLYQVWTAIGLNVMEAPEKFPRDTAMLDRTYMMDSVVLPIIEKRLTGGNLLPDCNVPAGITLTRIQPGVLWLKTPRTRETTRQVMGPQAQDSLPIYTQRYATAFSVRAQGSDIHFFSENLTVSAVRRLGKVIALQHERGKYPNKLIFEAVKASSAFPVAFQPVPLRYRELETGISTHESVRATEGRKLDSALFMDGGVFDNNPVSVALELHSLQGKREPPLDLLYVNPGHMRDSPATRGSASTIRPGGLDATVKFVGGAIPTARQYELQTLVRDSTIQERIPYQLLLTTRFAPIFGSHLSAFAAFISKPMREYDFYVGAYDALHFIAERYECAHAMPGDSCTRDALRQLIASGSVNLGHPGHTVAENLFFAEFRDSLKVAGPAPSHSLDTAKAAVFSAFHRALRAADSVAKTHAANRTSPDCGALLPAEYLLCVDGLREVVYTLIADTSAHVYERLTQVYCPDEDSRDCDDGLARLLNNPSHESDRLVEGFVARASEVERAARGGEKTGPVKGAIVAHWLYRIASNNRRGAQPDPSTIPNSGSWLHAVPFYFGGNLGSSGYETRWRPTYNVRTTWGVAVPLMAHFNNRVEKLGGDRELYLGIGGSVLLRRGNTIVNGVGKYLPFIKFVDEYGVGAHFWNPTLQGGGSFVEGELNARMIGGLLQVGWRPLMKAGYGRMHGDWWRGVSVGISDFNGLLYWMGRIN